MTARLQDWTEGSVEEGELMRDGSREEDVDGGTEGTVKGPVAGGPIPRTIYEC
jgi:hypothetical protein